MDWRLAAPRLPRALAYYEEHWSLRVLGMCGAKLQFCCENASWAPTPLQRPKLSSRSGFGSAVVSARCGGVPGPGCSRWDAGSLPWPGLAPTPPGICTLGRKSCSCAPGHATLEERVRGSGQQVHGGLRPFCSALAPGHLPRFLPARGASEELAAEGKWEKSQRRT